MSPRLAAALFPLVLALPSAAQTASFAWSATWDGPASQDDFVNEIAVDAAGNTYVAGRSFNATVGIPPMPPTQDAVVARYDASGVLTWSHRYDWIGGDDVAMDVAVDPTTGDVFVTGNGNGTLGGSFVTDLWLARYDAAGNVLWSVHHDGPGAGPEFGRSLLLDGAGRVYVGAVSYGGLATNNDMVVFCFDTAGVFQWEARVDGSGHVSDSGTFLALHPSGDLVLAGQLSSSSTNANVGCARVTTAGAVVWQVERDSPAAANDFGLSIACDAAGDVYVAGWSTIGDMAPTLVKWSGAGAFQWAVDHPETGPGAGQFREVVVDGRGFVDVLGHAGGVPNGLDMLTAQYDASGALVWERRADGAAHKDDTGRALAVDGARNVLVGGWSNGPTNLTTDADALVVRYDAAGNERWRHTGVFPAIEDRVQDLAVRPDGAIVYGAFLDPASYDILVVGLTEQGVPFCFGDGTYGACPCANESGRGLGQGCMSSQLRGATLVDTGIASLSADTLVLHGANMPNANALYIQGQTAPASPAPLLGDGLLCADGTIIRIGAKLNVAGASQYPEPGNASISVRGQLTGPTTRAYQVWYRNAAPLWCTAATFNLSNGLLVTWAP